MTTPTGGPATAATAAARRSTGRGAPTSRCRSRSGPGPAGPTATVLVRPGQRRATGGWPARAAGAAGATPASCPTAGGPRPSPSRARRARSSGTTSSWTWWPTSPWSASPTWASRTLISRISAAKPKIADYPFTTLEPHLGVVRADDESDFIVADIPGLVEGAAEGKGLGHRFLRHIERARVLVVLVDLDPVDRASPRPSSYRVLLDELGRYQPELLERPRLVVGSKADMAGACRTAGTLDRRRATGAAFRPDLVISAVTGEGIPELVGRLAALVDRGPRPSPRRTATIVVHRPLPEGFARGARRRRATSAVVGPGGRAGRGAQRPHHRRGRRLRPGPAAAARRRPGPGPGRGPRRRRRPHRRAVLHLVPRPARVHRRAGRPAPAAVTAGRRPRPPRPDRGGQDRLLVGHHADGRVDTAAIDKLAGEVAEARGRRAPGGRGHLGGHRRRLGQPWRRTGPGPRDLATLQAVAAVGQHRLDAGVERRRSAGTG